MSRFQNDGDIIVTTGDSTANSITGFIGTKGGNAYGSTVAVPVARQIMEALLVLEHIPPSPPKAANPV